MKIHRRLLPALLASLSVAAAAPLAARAQGSGRVLAYPAYERTGDTTDPFAQGGSCQREYEVEVRQIEADHQAGGQACFHPGNGQCHRDNNAKKASGLQAAGAKRYQCNQQAQAARQGAGQTQSRPQSGMQPPGRIDYEAVNESIRRQTEAQQAAYARELAAAQARAAAAQRAAEQARRAAEARRWAEANRFVDVLTGRRPPL